MSAPISRRQVWLRTAETLLIAACGGLVFVFAGFPAGLISGSLLAVAAAALLGRPMTVPLPLARVVFVVVGISLGAVVTPELLQSMASFPVTLAVLTVSTVCIIAATAAYLRIVHGWDAQTAVFGASPGALAQVMAMAAEYGADLRAIAIVQVMRVVLLTVGIPAGLALFGLSAGPMPRIAAGGGSPMELVVLIVASTATALAMLWLRLPGGRDRRGYRIAFRQYRSPHAAALPRGGARLVRGGHGGDLRLRARAHHVVVGTDRRCGGGVLARRPGHDDGAGAGLAPRSDLRRRAPPVALSAGDAVIAVAGAACGRIVAETQAAAGQASAGQGGAARGLIIPRPERGL
jgi:membrane AbrB-like protein